MVYLENVKLKDLRDDYIFFVRTKILKEVDNSNFVNRIKNELLDYEFIETEIDNWLIDLDWDMTDELESVMDELKFDRLWDDFKKERMIELMLRNI